MKGTAVFILPEYLREPGASVATVTADFPSGKEKKVLQRIREDLTDEYAVNKETDLVFGCLVLHHEDETITDLSEL
jgi:hypothetical protein